MQYKIFTFYLKIVHSIEKSTIRSLVAFECLIVANRLDLIEIAEIALAKNIPVLMAFNSVANTGFQTRIAIESPESHYSRDKALGNVNPSSDCIKAIDLLADN